MHYFDFQGKDLVVVMFCGFLGGLGDNLALLLEFVSLADAWLLCWVYIVTLLDKIVADIGPKSKMLSNRCPKIEETPDVA